MLRELFAKLGWKSKESGDPSLRLPAAGAVAHAPASEPIGSHVWETPRDEDDGAELALKLALERDFESGDAHHSLGRLYLARGRTEDAADCFQLAVHFSPRSAAAYADLGSALFALRRYEAAADACRKALEIDPAAGASWLRLANALKALGDLAAAAAAYRAAIERDVVNPAASCQLGFVLFKLGQYDESRQVFGQLIERQPDFAEAHHNFGLLELETGYAAEALASFRRALAIKPETIETRACVAHALRDLGRLDEALAAYDAVLAQHPQFGDARINRCYALLMRANYAAGWEEYEHRFAASETATREFGMPTWHGEPLDKKRILVFAEQGIGDEIMFASCLPDLLEVAGDCVIECNNRLASLFARSFPGAHVHGGNKNDDQGWIRKQARIDYQIAIGSLPRILRRAIDAFPQRRGYIKADPSRVEFWDRALSRTGKVPRIGISWRGGILGTRQFLRSTQLADWLPIIGRREYEFSSLQHGDVRRELTDVRERHDISLADPGTAVADLDELAAIISALDLVISVDNSVVHLAGALGKPVWVLLPMSCEWRYLRSGEVTPWYPAARLFRQVEPRNWDHVIKQVSDALEKDFPCLAA